MANNDFNERLRVLGEQFDSALKDESHGGRYNGVQKISDEPINRDGVDYYLTSRTRDGHESIGYEKVTPEIDEHFAELAKIKTAQDKIAEEIKAFYDKKFEMPNGDYKTDYDKSGNNRVTDVITVNRNQNIDVNYSSGNGSHKTLQGSASSPRKSLFDGMDIKGVSGSYKRMVNTTSVDVNSPFTKNEQELATKKTEVREKTQRLYEDFKELLPSQTAINKATGDFCSKLKQHYEEANPDCTVNFGKKTSAETGTVDYYAEFRPKDAENTFRKVRQRGYHPEISSEGKTSGDVLRISTVNGITLNDKPIAMCLRDASSEAAIKGINKYLDAAKAYVPDATEAVKERYEQMKAAIDKAKNNGDFGDDGNKGPNGPKGPGE